MIKDDTLREGLQAPGMAFTIDEKLKLASLLKEAGIRSALVSYPSAHESEVAVTKKIVEQNIFNEVFALGRTMKEDVDTILQTGANIALHLPFKIDDISKVYDAVKYASKSGKKIEVAIVDVIDFSLKDIGNIARGLRENGADIIQLPDTMGNGTPEQMRNVVRFVKGVTDAEIEIHCHNDTGRSIANAIAGIEAGADHVDTTIFGIGERNGISDTASVVSILSSMGNPTDIMMPKLMTVYDYLKTLIVQKIGTDFFADNFPIYGKNVKIHTAGTHAAFGDVFVGNNFSVNVYTGRSMLKSILISEGLPIDEKKLKVLMDLAKDKSVDAGKPVSFSELKKMWSDIYGESN